jgi:hypothetical protein
VAQLGARLDGIEEVVGSNPIGSTNSLRSNPDTKVTERTGRSQVTIRKVYQPGLAARKPTEGIRSIVGVPLRRLGKRTVPKRPRGRRHCSDRDAGPSRPNCDRGLSRYGRLA